MKITANEEYGLRIILKIAKILQNEDRLVSLNEIADSEGISSENTAAILSKLREGSLVESIRGKYGGYRLTKATNEINLYQVMSTLSKGTFDVNFCETHSGNQETCVHSSDCSVRSVWSNLNTLINNFLASITLEHLLEDEARAEGEIRGSFRILQKFTEGNLEGAGT